MTLRLRVEPGIRRSWFGEGLHGDAAFRVRVDQTAHVHLTEDLRRQHHCPVLPARGEHAGTPVVQRPSRIREANGAVASAARPNPARTLTARPVRVISLTLTNSYRILTVREALMTRGSGQVHESAARATPLCSSSPYIARHVTNDPLAPTNLYTAVRPDLHAPFDLAVGLAINTRRDHDARGALLGVGGASETPPLRLRARFCSYISRSARSSSSSMPSGVSGSKNAAPTLMDS